MLAHESADGIRKACPTALSRNCDDVGGEGSLCRLDPPTPWYPLVMTKSLDDAEAIYEGLRDRDRTVASLQSKQRMVAMFDHLLDDPARESVDERLRAALTDVRDRARELALELARAAFMEIEMDDLARMTTQLRKLETFLDAEPSARLDTCSDLLVFLREMRELRHPPRRRPRDYD